MGLSKLFRRDTDNDDEALPGEYLQQAPNTPVSLYDEAANEFAEIYGTSMVQATRMFLVALGAIGVALTAVIGMTTMGQLKEVRSWIVEVDKTAGSVSKPVEVTKVTPSIAVVKAELARWAEAVYGIDALRSRDQLRWANERTADKALAQFSEFRARERIYERMSREPEMVREPKVTGVDASQNGTAFVYVTTSERVGNTPAEKTKRFRVTLNYKLVAPKTEQEILANPLGLYVTFFSDVEERAQ